EPAVVTDALEAMAEAIGRLRARLIEPEITIDARAGLLVTMPGAIHAALTSGVRLYRARGGMPERLWTQAKRPLGIASRELRPATEPTQLADLFVLGTRDAFSVRAIGNLASTLARAPASPAVTLCEAVVAPCRESGLAAATVVLRAN